MDLIGQRRLKPPETDLESFRKSAQSAGDTLAAWIDHAKELENTVDELREALVSQQARNDSLKGKHSVLQDDYLSLHAEHSDLHVKHEGLRQSKIRLDAEFTDVLKMAKTSVNSLGREMERTRRARAERDEDRAKIETLQDSLAESERIVEVLQEEIEKFKALHANDVTSVGQRPIPGSGEDVSKDPAEHVRYLQAFIDRLQRKYDRLLAKKESAEKKFYASYVEWHGFKQWWLGFANFPGVSRRMITYNQEVKRGAWVPSGQGIDISGKGKILRVIEAAEEDPNVFPNMAPEEEPKTEIQADQDMQEKGDVHNLKEQLKTIYQQAQKMYESPAVGHPDLEPVQPSPTPMDSSGIPPDSEEPREPEHDDEEYLEEKADDSFDPEKTQETTPAKSQAQTVPFRFDISGINLPVFNLQTPTVPLPSSLSPEPSQVVVIKDEPQSPIKLLRPSTTSKPNPVATTIKATGAPNSVTSKALKHSNQPQTIQLPLVPPSTLGKRKAPTEDDRTPRTDVRRPARVELQLQLMDGTILPESSLESTAKKRRGLDEDDDMDSPSVRPAAGKGKGTAKEVTGSRGRISEGPGGNTTLNSRYEINPARNGGLNYAYDEVVRKKQERRKLDAGTCADCIEYYKTVGPMPPRAQAPLWRSPTSSQEEGTTARAGCTCAKGKSRQRDGDEEDDDEADTSAHQKEISRHRHQFPAGKSPPGYWELGFPDTQRVSEIREAAERMYEEKERTMEKEARKSDGKYRRR